MKKTNNNIIQEFAKKHNLSPEELRFLRVKIAYEMGVPIMDDPSYDAWQRDLEKQYPESKVFDVGTVVELPSIKKVDLPYPLISLENVYGDKGLNALTNWQDGHAKVLMGKYDGNSLEVVYNKGNPQKVFTRGTKQTGTDISSKIKYFNLPRNIPYKKKLVIPFEAILPISVFNAVAPSIYKEGEEKNPRNLLSGWLRKIKNVDVGYLGLIHFVALGVKNTKTWTKNTAKTKSATLYALEKFGFNVPLCRVTSSSSKLTDAELGKVLKWFKEKHSQYDMDGLVVEVDNIKKYEKLGYRGSKFVPKGAVAWKITSERRNTIIKKHILRVTRNGVISVTAEIKPVRMMGTEVSHAYLHNFANVKKNQLGVGAKIEVIKSGDIIPFVNKILKKEKAKLPKKCPSCKAKLLWDSSKVHLTCPNLMCSGRKEDALQHFVKTVGIENLSYERLAVFIKAGINTPYKVMTVNKKQLMGLEGFEKKMTDIIFNEIKKAKDTPLKFEKLAHALGVMKGFGKVKYKLVYDAMGEKCLDITLKNADYTEWRLLKTPGLGKVLVEEWISKATDLSVAISKLKGAIKINHEKLKVKSNKLKNMKFVFSTFRSDELEDLILENGGKVTGSVSKNTNVVFMEDNNSTSTKIDKAKELGKELITSKNAVFRVNQMLNN